MSSPLSIRFDDDVLARLRRRADGLPGATPSGVAQQLIDEGLRMSEFPGVVFKDGPSGRRAAIIAGPDIWEVITFLAESEERGELAVEAAAEVLALPQSRIRVALDYYSAYGAEVDRQILAAETASVAAEAAWQSSRELLA